SFQGLMLINYAKNVGANYIIRGVRSQKDFAFEKGMFHINMDINNRINTIFLIPPRELIEISSSMVKGLVGFDNWENVVRKYVPPGVFTLIQRKQEEKQIIKVLKKRWFKVFGSLGTFDAGRVRMFFDELIVHYTKECRAYHNIRHLKKCFEEFDSVREMISNQDIVELSIFFHDVIYIPESQENESQSAEYLKHVLRELYFNDEFIEKAMSYIMYTKHDKMPEDADGKMLVDIDLSVFASDVDEFAEYEKSIREEYQDFDDKRYLTGRIRVIEKFLNRENVYYSKHFRQKYEKHARRNLSRLLEQLTS
ncbi:MAG: hypothetical protein K8S87_03500, partial [Planctomycetes bacterium]|nr:hypothetical protein [Planctomycetota bacterium]